jgi:hypothetical protein
MTAPVPAAASAIVEPSTSPIVVAFAISRPPAAITVVANGFAAGSLAYVEQCDGVAPTTPLWSPTVHCDLGSSPAPAIADRRGLATFSSTDRNRAFRPFEGESPQSLFNCLAPAQHPPANGLATFTNCTLRVSTSNTAVTADQTFLAMELEASPAPPATGGGSTAAASTPPRTSKGASTIGSNTRPAKGGNSAGETSAGTGRVAVIAAPRHPSVGLLSFSDADLVTGYILVLGGLLITAVGIAVRRRQASGRRSSVVSAGVRARSEEVARIGPASERT